MLSRRFFSECALVLSLVVASSPAAAQKENPGCPNPGERRCGTVPKLTAAKAREFIDSLRTVPESLFKRLLPVYFGELYSKTFLDWVVFIRSDGTSKQALFANGKFVRNDVVRGQQSLAAVVFAEDDFKLHAPAPVKVPTDTSKTRHNDSLPGPAGPPGAGKAPGNLVLSRTTLQYTHDPALVAFLKSVTAGIVGPTAEPAAVPDSLPDLKLDDVIMSHDKDSTRLYFGYRRLLLPVNAIVRFTLRPNRDVGYDFPATTTISRTVENASPNRFGASLGLGLTLNAPDSTFAIADTGRALIVSSSAAVKPRVWLMAHFDIIQPQLPIRPQGFSVFVGTNLSTSDLFRDLLVGVGAGRLFGDVGVVAGINFIQRQTADSVHGAGGRAVGLRTHDYRRGKCFLGLDFAL
jgi:hypothetical protein